MAEGGALIKRSKSITVITDHTTLQHLPKKNDAENLTKVPWRFIPWLNVISPYLAINSETNKPILTISYRKGLDNDADALSRRPDLQQQLNEHDLNAFEKDLEELQSFISSMSHLMIDEQLLLKIREKSKTDLALKGPLLPPGVIYSETDNLYYFGDKLYIPNDFELIDSIIYEFHETNGHPNYVRTLANLSQLFLFSTNA